MTAITRGPELNLGALLDRNPQLQIPRDQYNINVTANNGNRLEVDELTEEFAAFTGAGEPAHLYFHLPLCNYICHFCNYVKRLVPRGREQSAVRLWSDLLAEESRRYLDRFGWIAEADIQSFYVGGGTAALLLGDEQAIGTLVRHVRENYRISENVEFNIEGNPENFGTA